METQLQKNKKKEIKMKTLITSIIISLIALGTTLNSQSYTNKLGNSYYHSDGSYTNKLGNSYYNSNNKRTRTYILNDNKKKSNNSLLDWD